MYTDKELLDQLVTSFDPATWFSASEAKERLKRLRQSNPEFHAGMVAIFRKVLLRDDLTAQQKASRIVGDSCRSEDVAFEYLKEVWEVLTPEEPFPER